MQFLETGLNELFLLKLNPNFIKTFIIIQFLVFFIPVLKMFRLLYYKKELFTKKVDFCFYFSCIRFFNFILPFKLGEIFSYYILKKKILNLFSTTTIYLASTKITEIICISLLSILFLIIFFFFTQYYNKISSFLFVFIFFIVFSFLFYFYFYLKKNKNKIFKAKIKNISLNTFFLIFKTKNFISLTFFISILQFFCTVFLIKICTDNSYDFELFFLTTMYIFLNLIPFKMPVNIGFFDFFAAIGESLFSYGIEFQNLILFRFMQLLIFSLDFILWTLIIYLRKLSGKYN